MIDEYIVNQNLRIIHSAKDDKVTLVAGPKDEAQIFLDLDEEDIENLYFQIPILCEEYVKSRRKKEKVKK